MSPLPKYAYTKRKNGKKAKVQTSTIRTGTKKLGNMSRSSASTSKFNALNMMRLKTQLMLNKKEEEFRELVQNFKEKNKGSIKEALNASRV